MHRSAAGWLIVLMLLLCCSLKGQGAAELNCDHVTAFPLLAGGKLPRTRRKTKQQRQQQQKLNEMNKQSQQVVAATEQLWSLTINPAQVGGSIRSTTTRLLLLVEGPTPDVMSGCAHVMRRFNATETAAVVFDTTGAMNCKHLTFQQLRHPSQLSTMLRSDCNEAIDGSLTTAAASSVSMILNRIQSHDKQQRLCAWKAVQNRLFVTALPSFRKQVMYRYCR